MRAAVTSTPAAAAVAPAAAAAWALLALGLAFGATGCFASWTAVQLSGNARLLDDSEREVSVPLPDVQEQLAVHVPLAIDLEYPPAKVGTVAPAPATSSAPAAASSSTPKPFAIGCEATQHARDQVYRSAFRYGTKTWRRIAATMFVLEAAAAAAAYFWDPEAPQNLLAAGALGLDALGTGVLFFAPRKEIYRTEQRPTTTRLRGDCPDGLALDIGGEVYPVDAAGRIGELGAAAIDAWMQAPGAPIRVTYAGQTVDVPLGRAEQCAWNRSHHREQPEPLAGCPPADALSPRQASVHVEVPVSTLTRLEPVAADAAPSR